MAAVLANHGGYYSPFAYISECRRMGLKVAGPSVNESEVACTGNFDAVRVGLSEIKGLTAAGVAAIMETRGKGGPFGSLQDLLRRAGITHDDARTLARAGALDELDQDRNRASLLYSIDQMTGRAKTAGEKGLFAETAREEESPGFIPVPHEKGTLRLMEWEALGFPVSFHPLSPFAPAIRRERARRGPPLIPGRDIARYPGRRVRLVGWRITAKPVSTKDGDPMEFVTFEDTTAIYETVLFPEVYAKIWSRLSSTRPFLLEGIVEMEFGVPTLTVEKLEVLEG
jgi:error-prone DNA polymerase